MRRVIVVVLGLVLGLSSASLALASGVPDGDCLACHGDKDLKSDAGRSLYVDAPRLSKATHGGLSCIDCHAAIKEVPHAESLPAVDCASCHDDVKKLYDTSVHGTLRNHGTTDAATCASCHGPAHGIVPRSDPGSRVARKNLPETCGACHANPEFLTRHKIPFAHPVEAYRLSVHGQAVEKGSEKAPSCSDCHGSHGILRGRDPAASINHWNVPKTCGACHTAIQAAYGDSVHGQAVARGVAGAPVCTDCHGEHTILAPSEPGSLVNPARVSSVTCGHCHADERLASRYNLPRDKVPAYQDSYHGLAQSTGSLTVANCASCHGVHNILASNDPRSTIHPRNLPQTCGNCHPGAGQDFAIGSVHVQPATASEHAVVRWIRIFYLFVIPATIGFMLLHNGLDFFAKLLRGGSSLHSGEKVPRMNLHFRIAHGLVVLSFPVLVITGFALKYPDAWWAAPLLRWEGEAAYRGLLHRLAAVALILAFAYHGLHLLLSKKDRRILVHALPSLQDLKDMLTAMRYNAGLSTVRPRFGALSYAEKAEYLAFVWGTGVMVVSGFALWFENFTMRHFPKWVTDAATALHWYEAILAGLAILVWHLYMVIFDPDVYPMDTAWITGRASAEHMRHNRPDYYRSLVPDEPAE